MDKIDSKDYQIKTLRNELKHELKESKELKECLRSLLNWQQEPEVKGQSTMSWIHGTKYTKEQTDRLWAPWKKAHELLGLEWKD